MPSSTSFFRDYTGKGLTASQIDELRSYCRPGIMQDHSRALLVCIRGSNFYLADAFGPLCVVSSLDAALCLITMGGDARAALQGIQASVLVKTAQEVAEQVEARRMAAPADPSMVARAQALREVALDRKAAGPADLDPNQPQAVRDEGLT